jgi:hypothetical protein
MLPAVVLRPTESDSAEDRAKRAVEATASADATLTTPELVILAARSPAAPTPGRLGFLPDLLRNSVACLAESIGFAALAFRPGQSVSLLDEWQDLWLSRGEGRARRRQRRPLMQAEIDYFDNLSRTQSGPVAPKSD